MSLIQTTDFFYPLVDDPYMQGRIGAANVLSDLYAMGIPECDNMLMILAVSRRMKPEDAKIVTQQMMKGFADAAKEAGTTVLGGQSVMNPWPIIGGAATAVRAEGDFIRPTGAIPGDVIILTKPIGTQVAVNCHQWALSKTGMPEAVAKVCTMDEQQNAFNIAADSMARLNKVGAELMLKYGAHAGTDVTGFGLAGHANNLAAEQKASVAFRIHTLPIIAKMHAVNEATGNKFKLVDGKSAETSGGLFVALPADKAAEFIKEIQEREGCPAWIIGEVIERDEKSTERLIITPDVKIVEVPSFKLSDEPAAKKPKV
eukprot:NODE_2624_length_1376_cov_86.573025_g2494_i0.p1 GENE.NODE_2624_length_1376_cov_86.573025_g2494_i0~~NODE_2624_length_1376_cov_86.573025_g2494_i0.p1  ORF type:complete len:315 (+),score=64.54 NODE_2624_length_1376_cov_86.573025_g2494_i0:174-1118(+)